MWVKPGVVPARGMGWRDCLPSSGCRTSSTGLGLPSAAQEGCGLLAREWRSELKCQKPESVRNQVCVSPTGWTWEAEHAVLRPPRSLVQGGAARPQGAQARVKSAAGTGEPASGSPSGRVECSEPVCSGPGGAPAGLPSVVSGLCSDCGLAPSLAAVCDPVSLPASVSCHGGTCQTPCSPGAQAGSAQILKSGCICRPGGQRGGASSSPPPPPGPGSGHSWGADTRLQAHWSGEPIIWKLELGLARWKGPPFVWSLFFTRGFL